MLVSQPVGICAIRRPRQIQSFRPAITNILIGATCPLMVRQLSIRLFRLCLYIAIAICSFICCSLIWLNPRPGLSSFPRKKKLTTSHTKEREQNRIGRSVFSLICQSSIIYEVCICIKSRMEIRPNRKPQPTCGAGICQPLYI